MTKDDGGDTERGQPTGAPEGARRIERRPTERRRGRHRRTRRLTLWTRADWRAVPEDPDPSTDLGYERVDLDVLPTAREGDSRVVLLPEREEMRREDAFLVVDEESVRDLDSMV